MTCHVCGSEQPEDYTFCSNCGHSRFFIPAADHVPPARNPVPVEASAPAPEPAAAPEPARTASGRPWWAFWR
jgi:hypothetical protein